MNEDRTWNCYYICLLHWCSHPTEDGVHTVLVPGDPPEECTAGGTQGGAVFCLLGQLERQLT